jgi:hypothetical protein
MAFSYSVEEAQVATVDGWIEKLFECKPLIESEVRQLCEKVCALARPPTKTSQRVKRAWAPLLLPVTYSTSRRGRC